MSAWRLYRCLREDDLSPWPSCLRLCDDVPARVCCSVRVLAALLGPGPDRSIAAQATRPGASPLWRRGHTRLRDGCRWRPPRQWSQTTRNVESPRRMPATGHRQALL